MLHRSVCYVDIIPQPIDLYGICCIAFVAWSLTLEPEDSVVNRTDNWSAEQSVQTQQSKPTEQFQAGANDEQVISSKKEKANKSIEKALEKENPEKAAKALSKVDESWSYAYYRDLLQDPIANRDEKLLECYLTIYRLAYPNTDKIDGILAVWDEIVENNSAINTLDSNYRASYGGIENANSKVAGAAECTFYVQYRLKNTMSNSDNDIISAIGEVIDNVQTAANEEYEYLANNVTNNLASSLVMGYIDTNVYAGDERYVLISDTPFSESGATTVYAYEAGTRTLSTTTGFEQKVPCFRVIDATTVE